LSIDADNVKAYIRFLRGDKTVSYDEDSLYDTLQDIIRLVMKRHFPMDDKDPRKEDVICIGLLKCIDLMNSDHIKPEGNVISMFYSGVRNSIGNSLKSEARKAKKMNDMLDKSEDKDIQEELNFASVDFRNYLRKFLKKISYYGNLVSDSLKSDLTGWTETPMDRAIVLTSLYRAAK